MKMWQPVEDGWYGDGRPRTHVAAKGRLISVPRGGVDPLTAPLPPDIRLCQLVDAPPVIPPEVAETVREELLERRKRLEYTVETYEMVKRLSIGEVAIKDKAKARIIAIDAALSWLNSVKGI